MLSDSMVQKKGYEALLKELGDIDIDRFIRYLPYKFN